MGPVDIILVRSISQLVFVWALCVRLQGLPTKELGTSGRVVRAGSLLWLCELCKCVFFPPFATQDDGKTRPYCVILGLRN